MNYEQVIEFLYSRLPMFSRVGSIAYKPDLSNAIELCSILGDPHQKFKSIHVAGTNGKGSVSHMLAAILQTAGYKTGLYTSPHLSDFRERIRIDGKMIPESDVVNFTEKIRSHFDKIKPSFFEVTVAMAFDYFAAENVEIAVIETGLGGRLDSTNIIKPLLSVITNIGMDHMNILGETLEKIAFEKAGIIKKEVPVVLGEVSARVMNIFEKTAEEKQAPMTIATIQRQVTDWSWEKAELVVEVAEKQHSDHKKFRLDLGGIYQRKNLLTVLEACTQVRKLGILLPDTVIYEGIRHTKKLTGLYGRWDIIHSSPLVVLDVAHNEDGIRALVEQIEVTSHRELHIVIGVVKDKAVEKILALLPKHAKYYFTKAQIPRALPEETLKQKANDLHLKGKTFRDVNAALEDVMSHVHAEDFVVVCGSLFVVGEVNRSLKTQPA